MSTTILDFPILSLLIFLPMIGALTIFLFIRGGEANVQRNAKNTALWTTLSTFVLSILLLINFREDTAAFQYEENVSWIEGFNINYHLGIDGISLFFILLTTLLMPICILASWDSIKKRVREYVIAFLLMESFIIGVFCALDFLLFYLFFEAMLIPMFLIIGIWGSENRVYAAFKFFLYTLIGSVLLLLALIYLYYHFGTTDIPTLMTLAPELTLSIQKWLWLALFASFAVKVPMWPFHTWLPDAHVQAPTAGSVILAGVLIKMGAYGFLRFSLPMLPDASVYFTPLVFGLSVIAVVYTSFVALMQEDMKKLIAYSSVAHMGYVTIGIFTLNQQGIEGGIIQMLSHGLVSGALFLCVGVLYDRMHTKEIKRYGGVVNVMPKYAVVFMLFTMASVGLPATSGFVGEFMVLLGVFKVSKLVAALGATALVLGAAYMLWLYARVVFGEVGNREVQEMPDLNYKEVIVFAPLVALVLLMGIFPSLFLDVLHVSVDNLMQQVAAATAEPATSMSQIIE